MLCITAINTPNAIRTRHLHWAVNWLKFYCNDLCCFVTKSSPIFRCTLALNPAFSVTPSSGVTVIFAPPRQHSLITVSIHNSGHFGPLYRFGPLDPRHCRGCQWLVTPLTPHRISSLWRSTINIGVTSYGALGHVPPLELGHVKKIGSFYDNNKH